MPGDGDVQLRIVTLTDWAAIWSVDPGDHVAGMHT